MSFTDIVGIVDTSTRSSPAQEWLQSSELADIRRIYDDEEEEETTPQEKWQQRLSLWAVRVGVFSIGVSSAVLGPNYPFLADVGSFEGSFPSTAPFGFAAATTFMRTTGLVSKTLSASVMGRLSDKIGRRPCLLFCVGISIFTTIAKYFAQDTFWGFNVANFCNGLFGVALPIGMAYVSEALTDQVARDSEISLLLGLSEFGMSGGGIVTILFGNDKLFEALWVGAGVNALAFVLLLVFLRESNHQNEKKQQQQEQAPDGDEPNSNQLSAGDDLPKRQMDNDNGDSPPSPAALMNENRSVLANIFVGAGLDNIGTAGLVPFMLTPLAFEAYLSDFVDAGETPLLSETGFKWMFILSSAMVLVGAMCAKPIFAKIGVPAGCVFGNLVTAAGIAGCLCMALIGDPTRASMAGFIVVYYVSIPLTVVSNMSTGPMLDRVIPKDKRGYYQGINYGIMSICSAIVPWLLGILADEMGNLAAALTAIVFSLIAAMLNVPLMFVPALRPPTETERRQSLSAVTFSNRSFAKEESSGTAANKKCRPVLLSNKRRVVPTEARTHQLVVPSGEAVAVVEA